MAVRVCVYVYAYAFVAVLCCVLGVWCNSNAWLHSVVCYSVVWWCWLQVAI